MEDKRVEYETALLAKEKGFDEVCSYWFSTEKYEEEIEPGRNSDFEKDWFKEHYEDFSCMAPTQSLLQKWLRERHDIYCEARHTQYPDGMKYEACVFSDKYLTVYDPTENPELENIFDTYEDALEDCFRDALKIVE